MSDSTASISFIAPDLSELAPLFPGYELEGLIATGGMGAVYCAVQKSLERTVAIKILPTELSKDAAFCAGFAAEAKAMARLNHPNLIGVYDFGEVNGMLYIVMEFVPGQSIYHSADGIAIDPQEVIRLVSEICDGLAHAHEHGIIHRDIKPSNILLALDAKPRIGDFGLARPIEKKIEEGEEIFGTPHYTAPEVVDNPHSVDYRADIFSVGVLLHELLTGKLPANDLRPASAISGCSALFDSIIARATQPHPAHRYACAKELAADLRAILTAPVAAPVAPPLAAPQVAGPIAGPRPSRPTASRVVIGKKKSSGLGQMFLTLLLIAAGYYVYITYYKPLNNPVAPPIKKVVEELPTLVQDVPEAAVTPPAPLVQPMPEASMPPEATASETAKKTAPSAEAPLPPKADIAEFFARARKVMQDKAIPVVSLYKANSKTNFTEFEQLIIAETRKMKSQGDRLDLLVAPIIKSWKSDIIPEDVHKELKIVPGIRKFSSPFLAKQASIESSLTQAVSQLRDTYILGLQLQSKRYATSADPGAVYLTDLEIKQTQDNPEYFRNLIFSNN